MNNPDDALRSVLLVVETERECEVGIHSPDSGGHSYGVVRHFLVFTCPRCGEKGCLSACKNVAERVARNPVWMLQCMGCSYAGSRYVFKTEVRGI